MTTTDEYLALITSEHQDKPLYLETVTQSVEPLVKVQNVMAGIMQKYDIDTAVGVQLDVLGEWIGRSRFIETPIEGVYFEWQGTVATGWRSGVWRGIFDPVSGLVAMPDELYRLVLKAKIGANSWDGSIPAAYAIYQPLFPNNTVMILDNQDMTMTIAIAGAPLDPISQALLTGGYIPLKPEGVRIAGYIFPVVDAPLFGWDIENEAIDGWDIGQWGEEA